MQLMGFPLLIDREFRGTVGNPADYPEGILICLDKPYKWTSADVVRKIKFFLQKTYHIRNLKVGHAGTLDPLATGLLIICIGKATKQIETLQSGEKEYTGTFVLGATTPCFDLEKAIDATYPTEHITEEMLRTVVQSFVGEIEQVPPTFSAVKINGRRAFDYARNNEEIEIKPKRITISEFELTRIAMPEVDFRIVCGKGTYIRSIARDFGAALDSGAHLKALRRTRIGNYRVEDAQQIDDVREIWKNS